MSTITTPPRPSSRAPAPLSPSGPGFTGDRRITIRGLSWDLYDRLSDAVGPRQAISLAYDGKDLEIIDLSPSEIDRPAIYAALQVAEVWRFDGEDVVIEQLQPDGTYSRADASRFLPVTATDILRWLVHEDSADELDFERRLAEWAKALRR